MLSSNPVVHPLVEQIHATHKTVRGDGSEIVADSFIPADECELLYRAVEMIGATRGVETGMAYGVSSLCLADALHRNGGDAASLISIDPCQTSDFGAAAIHLIARAGLGAISRVIEEPSQLALPRLVSSGERVDVGFIDGWHTFDHTLIDFFYIDLMLEDGGIIVFDDVGYPAINAVVRFVLSNRDYELVDALAFHHPVRGGLRLRRTVKRLLRPFARTDRDPAPRHEALFRKVDAVHAVAVRKRGGDRRRFDHYERF